MKKKKKKGKKKKRAAAAEISLGTKLQYVGVGMVLGVVAAPTIRQLMERARPELEKLFERLTTSAEELAENASDFMSTARERVRTEAPSLAQREREREH